MAGPWRDLISAMTLETCAPNDPTPIMFTALEPSSVGDCALRGEERLAAGRTGDTNLVLRIRAGDQSAFRELVERHQSRIFRVVYGILNHKADAEDVAQDVFAKVYFAIHRFDHRSALVTWIYRIAVNEAYSHLRKMRTRRRYEGDQTVNAVGGDLHWLID